MATAIGFYSKGEEVTLGEGETTKVSLELSPDRTARIAPPPEPETERTRPVASRVASSGGMGAAPIVALASANRLTSQAPQTASRVLPAAMHSDVPIFPAVKSLIAHKTGDREWRRARPPLSALAQTDHALLTNAYSAIFTEKAA